MTANKLTQFEVKHEIDCALACVSNRSCLAYNFCHGKICQLLSRTISTTCWSSKMDKSCHYKAMFEDVYKLSESYKARVKQQQTKSTHFQCPYLNNENRPVEWGVWSPDGVPVAEKNSWIRWKQRKCYEGNETVSGSLCFGCATMIEKLDLYSWRATWEQAEEFCRTNPEEVTGLER